MSDNTRGQVALHLVTVLAQILLEKEILKPAELTSVADAIGRSLKRSPNVDRAAVLLISEQILRGLAGAGDEPRTERPSLRIVWPEDDPEQSG